MAKAAIAIKEPSKQRKPKVIAAQTVEIIVPKKKTVAVPVKPLTELDTFNVRRANISAFLSSRIVKVEAKTGMVANSAKYLDPQSTNSLCLDWLTNGGIYNAMTIVSGPEMSGKTTVANEVLASGLQSSFVWSSLVDAEGTLNDEYFAAMMRKLGIDLTGIQGRPFRYYKENVIETVFDYMVGMLNDLPRKVWSVQAGCWTYQFPKRDDYFKKLMEVYEVKPDRALTTEKFYVCPTNYSGLEAAITIDSFAAMLTERDEDEGERSKIRAAEAQAFSNHLKRVAAKISNRGVMLFGVNQSRDIPDSNGYGPKIYQPGGKALGFYSAQRAEFTTRASGWPSGLSDYDKKLKCMTEPSVMDGYMDRYVYKAVKSTKNKMGNPGKETWMRIWTADWQGNPHGIDPAFDLMMHLQQTGQITKTNRKKNMQNFKFNVHASIGSKRASYLNSLPEFTELDLKTLTLSEVFKTRELIKLAQDRMQITKIINLRNSLFAQMHTDKSILALSNGKVRALTDDVDYEDDDVKEL